LITIVLIILGLREGTIVYFQFSWSLDNKPILNRPIVRRIGTFPIKFITPQPNSMIETNNNIITNILALSDRPWQIKHIQHTGLDFACVAFEHYEHVQEATIFNYDENFKNSYMIVSKNCLNFVQLNNFIKNDIRTINIADVSINIIRLTCFFQIIQILFVSYLNRHHEDYFTMNIINYLLLLVQLINYHFLLPYLNWLILQRKLILCLI